MSVLGTTAWQDVIRIPVVHPILVNFTAALIPVSVFFDWLGKALRQESLRQTGWWTLLFAATATPLTALTGYLWMHDHQAGDHPLMSCHMWIGVTIAVVTVALCVWRGILHGKRQAPGYTYLSSATILVLLVIAQGNLGGLMAFGGHHDSDDRSRHPATASAHSTATEAGNTHHRNAEHRSSRSNAIDDMEPESDTPAMPVWLRTLALVSLAMGGLSALVILIDILSGNPQNMWIMNVVWPATALWSGPIGLYAYFSVGRLATRRRVAEARERGEEPPHKTKPFWKAVGVGVTHCGSGCTLGDICAEWLAFFVPGVLVWFGYQSLFEHKIFAAWGLDYLLAFAFGVAFQYFTIKPMKGLSVGAGLKEAVKADTLSLTAWQVGMYGWMAIATFAIFGHEIHKANPVFWFMMQIAMMLGFMTSYPVNWWLLRRGIKEKM